MTMREKQRQKLLVVLRVLPWVFPVVLLGFMGPAAYGALGIESHWHMSLTAVLITGIGIVWSATWRPVGPEAEWIRLVPWIYGALAAVLLMSEIPSLLGTSGEWGVVLRTMRTVFILVACGWVLRLAARRKRSE